MTHSILLPFGSSPYVFEVPANVDAMVVHAPAALPARPLPALLDHALEHPIAAPRLQDAVAPGARVVIVVSDATRADPRDVMIRALLARMPSSIELTIAVANGTHGPADLGRLGIGADIWSRARVINHDAHTDAGLVTIGVTRRGTPVKLHRCAVEADWVIATGRIKPHYFAGYGAGCKAIFPGLGGNREVRMNHELKREPGSRPGRVEGNPCRDDLEEAVAMLPSRTYLLNLVVDHEGGAQRAVAGHVRAAFVAGARACEPMYRVSAPPAELVIVSDALPLAGSLYQASKLVAAAAELLLDRGTMIIAAECPEGIGPMDTVNRGIYQIGLAPRLPPGHRLLLVSGLDRDQVAPSYCQWAPSIESAIAGLGSRRIRATIIPRAGELIIDPCDWPS
jgi:lactate racemase